MHLFKFSILAFAFSLTPYAFDDNNCFREGFEVEVIHKGQPFGLLPVVLKIQKSDCDIKITHEKMKYQKSFWKVDVCRAPVHIKKGDGAVEVIKKTQACSEKSADPFCIEFAQIKKIIQDDGLIFADGQKENLKTDHGKTYCSYLLLEKYLRDSLVFTRGKDYSSALTGGGYIAPVQSNSEENNTSSTIAPRPEVEGEAQSQPDVSQPDAEPVIEEKKEEKGKGFF